MDLTLESLSKEEPIALINKEKQSYIEERIAELEDENAYLKSQLEMYKRMQFGQKRERFRGDPAQIALPFEAPAQQIAAQEEILKEKIGYIRSRPNHKGRAALPSHLPVKEPGRRARLRFILRAIFQKWSASVRKLPKIGPISMIYATKMG